MVPAFSGEREAAATDDLAADMFDAAVVTPVVETLAELAGEGRALDVRLREILSGARTSRVAMTRSG
jgi:hypothetical protein